MLCVGVFWRHNTSDSKESIGHKGHEHTHSHSHSQTYTYTYIPLPFQSGERKCEWLANRESEIAEKRRLVLPIEKEEHWNGFTNSHPAEKGCPQKRVVRERVCECVRERGGTGRCGGKRKLRRDNTLFAVWLKKSSSGRNGQESVEGVQAFIWFRMVWMADFHCAGDCSRIWRTRSGSLAFIASSAASTNRLVTKKTSHTPQFLARTL